MILCYHSCFRLSLSLSLFSPGWSVRAMERARDLINQPFAYVALAQDADDFDEKATPLVLTREQRKKRPTSLPRLPSRSDQHPSPAQASAQWTPWVPCSPQTTHQHPSTHSQFVRQPLSLPAHTRSLSNSSYQSRRRSHFIALLRPWLPLIMYAITSLAFVVAFAFYRTELFNCMSPFFLTLSDSSYQLTVLDDLSLWLRSDEQYGHAVLFSLIFLTTIRKPSSPPNLNFC